MRALYLLCVSCLVLIVAFRVEAGPAHTYLPLHVGNSWTYVGEESVREFTIIGQREIAGETYYEFDDHFVACCFPGYSEPTDLLFRYAADGRQLLQYDPSNDADVVRYDFSDDLWGPCGNQLTARDFDCTVPAGHFENCLQFDYATYVDCGVFHETLAADVGSVAFFSSWDGAFRLQRYTIVPEPSTIVALFSMGLTALLFVSPPRKG